MEDLIQIVRKPKYYFRADLNHDFNQTDLTDDNPMITSKEGRANFVTKYDLKVQYFLLIKSKNSIRMRNLLEKRMTNILHPWTEDALS